MTKTNDDIHVNKNTRIPYFGNCLVKTGKMALSLYNAVNHTSYTDPDDLEYTTLEDVIYMKYKNDVSFLVDKTLSLYEHQSSYNPNMPPRGFLYYAGSVLETDSPFRAAVQQASVENPTPPLHCIWQWK